MVTVIIPVLNEEATIASVVEFALSDPIVKNVIVVDDASTDGTVEQAKSAGARVIQSTLLGKGASMHDGVVATWADCIVFLHGDLQGLETGLIGKLVKPVLDGEADFVKAGFSRLGGRVTVLTVRPLLQVFFPGLSRFSQPIGGIFAARRELLLKLEFEPDYGVDIGLLIDAHMSGARLAEVDIGSIEHDSQDLGALGRMAQQVVRVIMGRAAAYGRFDQDELAEMREVERHLHASLEQQSMPHRDPRPLVLLPVDNVVLEGQLLRQLALHLGLFDVPDQLEQFDTRDSVQLQQKAALFRNVPMKRMETVARLLPLNVGVVETVRALRRQGYRVAVVGELFHAAIEILRRRVYAHLALGHVSQRSGSDQRTGEVVVAPEFTHQTGCGLHAICMGNVALNLREHYGLEKQQVIAVGLPGRDSCLLRLADRSFVLAGSDVTAHNIEGHLDGDLTRLPDLCGPA